MNEPTDVPATSDEQNIRHLEGVAGIRHRPAMYIGDTGPKGLHHLVYEVVDNSVDEVVNGYASSVNVKINTDGSVTTLDDGRGIPVAKMETKEGLMPALQVVLTQIHAGGKFSREDGYNLGTSGLHGVGITAVNACSEWLEVEVRRDGQVWTMDFARGELTSELKVLGKTDQTGTKMTFKPDNQIFPDIKFSYDVLHKRMQELAFLTPGMKITISDERTGQSDEFLYEDGLIDFVHHLNRTVTPLYPEVIRITGEGEGSEGPIQVDIALQHHDSPSEDVRGFANNVYNPDGGTHISGFRSALTRTINAYGKKENMFKDFTPVGDDFREGLTAVITVRHPNPSFEAQTKVKLANTDAESVVQTVVNDQLAKYFEENPSIAKLVVKAGLRAAEAREAAKKARDMVRKGKGLTTGGLPDKLRDCRSRDLAETELYMVEGLSAGGSADTGRDSATQAILPLRGKILNVEKAQLVKLLDNAEIANIFKAVGVPPGAQLEDVNKRRYGKLILMMDADVDGSHIRTLLLTFLFRHMRELVKEGCVYLAQPPLYRVSQKGKGKQKPQYVQTHEEMMSQLVGLGLNGSTVRVEADGTVFEGDHLQKIVNHLLDLEEPLETLDRRGVDLRLLVNTQLSEEGKLPRYRVFIGKDQHWFFTKPEVEAFLAEEQAKRGEELTVVDADASVEVNAEGEEEAESAEVLDSALQMVDLHEMREINQVLAELRAYGIGAKDFLPAGLKNAEQVYPFTILNSDGDQQLTSLREVLPKLREMGERGLIVTRFKGLGEMDADELWETSMDPENRVLLQVTMEDAAAADEIFRILMGDHVEPRREFIEKHALEVKDLDV